MKLKIALVLIVLAVGIFVVLHATLPYKADRMVVKPKTINDYFDSTYNENILKAGFTNTDAAKRFKINQTRKSWKELGYDFFTDDEMKQFLKDNDFILGESSRYIKNVPEASAQAIVNNLIKIRKKACVYTLRLTHDDKTFTLSDEDVLIHGHNDSWASNFVNVSSVATSAAMSRYEIPDSEFWELTYSKDVPVYVIGGANDFNRDGMHILDGILRAIPPKDPIAVVKVDDGYIQIAQW